MRSYMKIAKHNLATPSARMLTKEIHFFIFELAEVTSIGMELLELVYKLIENVPQPLHRQLETGSIILLLCEEKT